jgi:hypothetical protein
MEWMGGKRMNYKLETKYEDSWGYGGCTILSIEHNGKVIVQYSDGGEPEDNLFLQYLKMVRRKIIK